MRTIGGVELVEQRAVGDAIVSMLHARKGRMPSDVGDWHDGPNGDRGATRALPGMLDIYRLLDRAREHPGVRGGIPGPGYVVNTGGSAIALAAAAAKTCIYINAGSNVDTCLSELCLGFDGVTSSAIPALVELTFGTKASLSTPGTSSTSFTPLQNRGWAVKSPAAAAANTCTSEPTVQTSHRQWLVSPNGGLLIVQFPLGKEPTGHNIASTSGLQIAIRATAPAIVNVRGYTEHDE